MFKLLHYIAGIALILISLLLILYTIVNPNGVLNLFIIVWDGIVTGIDPKVLGSILASLLFNILLMSLGIFLFSLGKRFIKVARALQ